MFFRKGYTMMELTIVIALIATVSLAAIILINPKKQMQRAWDMQKQHELTMLRKMFENYYNDNNSYPRPEEVCANSVMQDENGCYCQLCGLVKNNFSDYLSRLFCDPQHPKYDYLFQFDCDNPQEKYRLCAVLTSNEQLNRNKYNYGVASPNESADVCQEITIKKIMADPDLPRCVKDQDTKLSCLNSNICNVCGTFAQCMIPTSCDEPVQIFSDRNCKKGCRE